MTKKIVNGCKFSNRRSDYHNFPINSFEVWVGKMDYDPYYGVTPVESCVAYCGYTRYGDQHDAEELQVANDL